MKNLCEENLDGSPSVVNFSIKRVMIDSNGTQLYAVINKLSFILMTVITFLIVFANWICQFMWVVTEKCFRIDIPSRLLLRVNVGNNHLLQRASKDRFLGHVAYKVWMILKASQNVVSIEILYKMQNLAL